MDAVLGGAYGWFFHNIVWLCCIVRNEDKDENVINLMQKTTGK